MTYPQYLFLANILTFINSPDQKEGFANIFFYTNDCVIYYFRAMNMSFGNQKSQNSKPWVDGDESPNLPNLLCLMRNHWSDEHIF